MTDREEPDRLRRPRPGDPDAASAADAALRGCILAAVVPGQPGRVLSQAARYARLHDAPLLVVNVDVTRFVTYEDPDGYVHTAPIDLSDGAGRGGLDRVRRESDAVLTPLGQPYALRQVVGDPALAIKHLAEDVDARLIVIGTRNRGFGETLREFFTGSVAARLAHRQHRPVLVVPLGESAADDEPLWGE